MAIPQNSNISFFLKQMIATNNACGCSANGARRSQSTGGSSVLLRVFIVTPLACIFANQDCLHRKYGWVYSLVAHLDTYRSLLFHHSYKISSLLLEFRREKSLNLMHNILKWVCCNYTKRSNYFFFCRGFNSPHNNATTFWWNTITFFSFLF